MGFTADERNQFIKKCKDTLQTGSGLEGLLQQLFREDLTERADENEFVEIISSLFPAPADDIVDKLKETTGIKVKSISRGEKDQRAQLSKQALETYVRGLYLQNKSVSKLYKAVSTGELTKDDIESVSTTRDGLTVLLDIYGDEFTDQSNLDIVKMASGKGLDPKDPHYADYKQQMFANAVNIKLREFLSYDFSKAISYTDEELVEKWPEIQSYFGKLAIIKSELNQRLRNNPYLDTQLALDCLKKEELFFPNYMMLSGRMRAIANPYYSQARNEDFLGLDDNRFELINDSAFNMNLNMQAYFTELATAKAGHATSLMAMAKDKMQREFNLQSDGELRFFDQDGNLLDDFSIRNPVIKNQPIFACYLSRVDKMVPITIDSNSLKISVLKKNNPQASNLPIALAAAQAEASRTNLMLDEYFHTTGVNFVEGETSVANENIKKNLDTAAIRKQIIDFYEDDKIGLYKIEFINMFKKAGLNPRVISEDETNARKALTKAAHEINYDAMLERNNNFSVKNHGSIPGINTRTFDAVMLKWSGDSLEYNTQFIEKFNAPNADRSALVKEAFERHLKNEALFDKALTDEELVQNWKAIQETGVAIGMEYEGFCSCFDAMGVKLDADFKKRMDAFHEKVDAFNMFYRNRMEYIGSKYYRFGCDECVKDVPKVFELFAQLDGPLLAKNRNTYIGLVQSRDHALAYFALNQGIKDGKNYTKVFDSNGEAFDPKDFIELGNRLNKGEPLYYMGEDKKIYPIKSTKAFSYPPELVEAPAPNKFIETAIKTHLELGSLKASERNKYEKQIVEGKHKSYIKLLAALNNKGALNYDDNVKEALADLCTYLTVEKMVCKNGIDEQDLKLITSRQNIEEYRKVFLEGDMMGRVVDAVKAGADNIPQLGTDGIYKGLLRAHAQVSFEKQQAQAKQKQDAYIKFRDDSIKKKTDITKALDIAVRRGSDKPFFGDKIDKQELHSKHYLPMNIDRCALESLTLALMLSQGYSVEEALHPENAAADRAKMAETAVKMIEAKDVAVIRENYIRGLNVINEYVAGKLNQLSDYRLSTLAKPENNTLIVAAGFIKDMSQEFDCCQEDLPKEKRLSIKACTDIQQRGEVLGTPFSKLINSKYEPADMSFGEIQNAMAKYVVGALMNKYIKTLRDLPENKGKSFEEAVSKERMDKFNDAYAQFAGELFLTDDLRESPEKLQKVYDALCDDSFKDNLNISFTVNEETKEPEFTFTLDTAIKKAAQRQSLTKAIDKSLDEPVKAEPVKLV